MAKKAQDIRPKITLACTECKERNYITKKNRRNSPDRLEVMKYCKRQNKRVFAQTQLVRINTLRAREHRSRHTSLAHLRRLIPKSECVG